MKPLPAAALLLLTLTGCGDPAGAPPPARPHSRAVESSWNEQVDAVRSGRHDEIRFSGEIDADQLDDLSSACENLTTLVLERARLSDADLHLLAELPRLRQLKLPMNLGDEGAAAIAACEALEILNLPNATLTDAGLAHIAGIESLELLRLGSPNVTDEGLKELIKLPRLRFLHLIDVPITDAALSHIAAIRTLESFYIDGGNASDDALRKLLAERPDLHFHRDQRHLSGDPNAGHHGE